MSFLILSFFIFKKNINWFSFASFSCDALICFCHYNLKFFFSWFEWILKNLSSSIILSCQKNIVNSRISFSRASNGSGSLESICSCSAQRLPGACTSCEFAREQLRVSQKLLRSKISINVSILWKMRPIFEKCSWLITSNILHTHILHTHTHGLRITLAKKSSESIDSVIQLKITWMISLSQCSRRCGLTKNIKNLFEFCEFCNLTSSRLNFKLFVNTLTFCDCIKLSAAALSFPKQCVNQI